MRLLGICFGACCFAAASLILSFTSAIAQTSGGLDAEFDADTRRPSAPNRSFSGWDESASSSSSSGGFDFDFSDLFPDPDSSHYRNLPYWSPPRRTAPRGTAPRTRRPERRPPQNKRPDNKDELPEPKVGVEENPLPPARTALRGFPYGPSGEGWIGPAPGAGGGKKKKPKPNPGNDRRKKQPGNQSPRKDHDPFPEDEDDGLGSPGGSSGGDESKNDGNKRKKRKKSDRHKDYSEKTPEERAEEARLYKKNAPGIAGGAADTEEKGDVPDRPNIVESDDVYSTNDSITDEQGRVLDKYHDSEEDMIDPSGNKEEPYDFTGWNESPEDELGDPADESLGGNWPTAEERDNDEYRRGRRGQNVGRERRLVAERRPRGSSRNAGRRRLPSTREKRRGEDLREPPAGSGRETSDRQPVAGGSRAAPANRKPSSRSKPQETRQDSAGFYGTTDPKDYDQLDIEPHPEKTIRAEKYIHDGQVSSLPPGAHVVAPGKELEPVIHPEKEWAVRRTRYEVKGSKDSESKTFVRETLTVFPEDPKRKKMSFNW